MTNEQWASSLERAVNVNFAISATRMVADRRFEDGTKAARIIYVMLLKDRTDLSYAKIQGSNLDVDMRTIDADFNDLMDSHETTHTTKKYYRYRGKIALIQNYLKHNERIS
jgi:hypothetical protein